MRSQLARAVLSARRMDLLRAPFRAVASLPEPGVGGGAGGAGCGWLRAAAAAAGFAGAAGTAGVCLAHPGHAHEHPAVSTNPANVSKWSQKVGSTITSGAASPSAARALCSEAAVPVRGSINILCRRARENEYFV